jgi:hypothetical protein
MFLARNVSKELWAEAIGYAVYIQNRTLSSTGEVTPYEALNGRKPIISNLRIFRSPAFVHVPDARRQKLGPKAIEEIFVGCCPFKKAYRIWVKSKRKIEINRNGVVDEPNNLPQPDDLQSTPQSTPFQFFFRREIWSTLMSCQWKLKIKPKVLLMLLWEQRRCPINFKKVLTYKM